MRERYAKQVRLLVDVLPAIRWKLQNIETLKAANPKKHGEQAAGARIAPSPG